MIVVVPGGREGAARAGALPTPELVADWTSRRPMVLRVLSAGRRRTGPRRSSLEGSRTCRSSASLLTLPTARRSPSTSTRRRPSCCTSSRAAATLTVNGVTLPVTATSVVQIPPNTKHAFTATSDVRALQIYAPGGPRAALQAAMIDIEPILAGDVARRAARLMRDLDDRRPDAIAALKQLFPHTGKAYIVGITGNPGAGKSTVVDALIAHYRAAGETVGVVASIRRSPFSGGAILGDRIRMQRHALDPGVFIRSLATRGHLGGLSRSTFESRTCSTRWASSGS